MDRLIVKSQRLSNIEALRVVSMLLVIISHSTSLANGRETAANILSYNPFGALFYADVQAISAVCVDCFVLISGYFGIKARWQGLCKLLFIVYFWRLALCLASSILTGIAPSARELVFLFNPFTGEWFVGAYIGLYAVSFILNGFCSHSPKEEFKRGVTVYVGLMLLLGWVLTPVPTTVINFGNGYSTLSLIGIYLIGRYIGKYKPTIDMSVGKILTIFIALPTINTVIYLGTMSLTDSDLISDVLFTWFVSYDSAFTLLATISLFYVFTKFSFTNRFVNWLAASAFAVYLIHINPHVLPYFLDFAHRLFVDFWPWLWLPAIILFACSVYLVCTIVDQLRIWSWNLVSKTAWGTH